MECSSCGAPLRKRCRNCPECGASQKKSSAEDSQQPQAAQVSVAKHRKKRVTESQGLKTTPVAIAEPQTFLATTFKNMEPQAESASAAIAEQAEPKTAPAPFAEHPAAQTVPMAMAEQTEPQPVMEPVMEKELSKPVPSLIEFPGVTKTSTPQWRKELGERVREVQERRAREAMLEALETVPEPSQDQQKTSPLLELLPQADVAPLNPLVEAALRRIERANASSQFSGNAATATVVAYDEQPEVRPGSSPSDNSAGKSTPSEPERKRQNGSSSSEKSHNLAVVPSFAVHQTEAAYQPRKPKRLIGGDHDPALNYLDTIRTTPSLEVGGNRSAPVFFRILSAILDLLIVCLLSSPVVALVKLTELDWLDLRVITFVASTLLVTGFLYLTINIALTGRTPAMRLFSLRVVDARTGLIPTGTQSAGRALVFMLSLASAGVLLMYMFIDSEKHTAHDRFTRTAVIRV
jgi:uncharacterized RDD family membrane protein YckC